MREIKRVFVVLLAMVLICYPSISLAHGGGLDSSGCHNDNIRGGRHCHSESSSDRKPPDCNGSCDWILLIGVSTIIIWAMVEANRTSTYSIDEIEFNRNNPIKVFLDSDGVKLGLYWDLK